MFKNSQFSKRALWILVATSLIAGKAWAEDDIPPIYPLVDNLLKWLHDLWVLISGCFC